MIRHSFRLRLTLLSVGVSGLVLAVFAILAWALVYRFALRQIDREMGERMGPIMVVSHLPEHWGWIVNGLQMSYGGPGESNCVVLVKGTGGRVLQRTSNWPTDLLPETFPDPSPTNPKLRAFPPPPSPASQPIGSTKGSSATPKAPGPMAAPMWQFLPVTPPEFQTRRASGRSWRVGVMQNSEATLAVGVSLDRLSSEMARVRMAFVAALPAALICIAAGSWLLSRRALRSVENLAEVAERVTASSLDRRIPVEGVETEFRRLATVFNDMLDRLEKSFTQAVRFSADAAHELRTPLTILQGEIEQAMQETVPGSREQRVYGGLLEEVHRLKAITQKLLLLSRADAGQLHLAVRPVNLTELIQESLEDTEALAPSLEVRAELHPNLQVMADPDLLQQAIANLFSNAVKYNREGGTIELQLAPNGAHAEFLISNTGPGIPPDDRDKLFERFYRGDRSRGRRVDGVGLGLSLAREIARAHGGDLVLAESANDRTTFLMTLPLLSSA